MAKKITLKALMETDEKEVDKILTELPFEQGLELTDELVEKVENGNFTLEESLTAYQRGVSLIKKLKGTLSEAEKKLEVL